MRFLAPGERENEPMEKLHSECFVLFLGFQRSLPNKILKNVENAFVTFGIPFFISQKISVGMKLRKSLKNSIEVLIILLVFFQVF